MVAVVPSGMDHRPFPAPGSAQLFSAINSVPACVRRRRLLGRQERTVNVERSGFGQIRRGNLPLGARSLADPGECEQVLTHQNRNWLPPSRRMSTRA
jgi:hypothetical protein